MTIPAENITNILRQDWQHVSLKYGIMRCGNCGEEMPSRKRPMSFENHVYALAGFVMIHLKCEITNPADQDEF
jgi:uncharacterized protein (UPF0212 family)